MNIPKDIIEDLVLHVETEIQAGRRLQPIKNEVYQAFRSLPEPSKPKQTVQKQPLASNVPGNQKTRSASPEAPTSPPQLETLDEIAAEIRKCQRCNLSETRKNPVPGAGCINQPDILFIGEGPGADEDACGEPFVGRAGQLLTNMIAAMGYSRDEVFISNVIKCRPPENRTPKPDEMAACLPWLIQQTGLLKPKCIVSLGGAALCGLEGNPNLRITKDRGIWRKFQGVPMMPTFHPAYLLRFPKAKREAWNDLKKVLEFLGKTPPVPVSEKR